MEKMRWIGTKFILVYLILFFLILLSNSNLSVAKSQLPSAIIDSRIEEKLNIENEVMVYIELRDEINLSALSEKSKETKDSRLKKISKEVDKIQMGVTPSLSDASFKVKHKFLLNPPAFSGYISRDGLDKLKNNPLIKKIELVDKTHATLAISANLVNVKNDVWNLGYAGGGQTICIVDSGIDYTHSDLGGCSETSNINDKSCAKVVGGYNYCADDACTSNNQNPLDDFGHGTHVAGIVASTDSTYKGLAYDAKLIAVKVLNSEGEGTTDDLRDGIEWCIYNSTKFNISVITISINVGATEYSNYCDNIGMEVTKINDAVNDGIFVSVASGNLGYTNGIGRPACASGATSTGAVYDKNLGREPDSGTYQDRYGPTFANCSDVSTDADIITCFTNRGNILDFLAPGCRIDSTKVNGGSDWMCGTSQATPHIAGAAALIKQFIRELNGSDYSPDAIKQVLNDTGVPIYDAATGLTFPRIDVAAAISALTTHSIGDDDISGEVRQDQTWKTKLTVSDVNNSCHQLEVHTGDVSSSDVELTLTSPTGQVYNEESNPTPRVTIPAPETGIWTIKVYGNDIDDYEEFTIETELVKAENLSSCLGGINFTSLNLNYISACDTDEPLQFVLKGKEANATETVIDIENATNQALDAFMVGLVIPDNKIWDCTITDGGEINCS